MKPPPLASILVDCLFAAAPAVLVGGAIALVSPGAGVVAGLFVGVLGLQVCFGDRNKPERW